MTHGRTDPYLVSQAGVDMEHLYAFADENNVTALGGYAQTIGTGWFLVGDRPSLTLSVGLTNIREADTASSHLYMVLGWTESYVIFLLQVSSIECSCWLDRCNSKSSRQTVSSGLQMTARIAISSGHSEVAVEVHSASLQRFPCVLSLNSHCKRKWIPT